MKYFLIFAIAFSLASCKKVKENTRFKNSTTNICNKEYEPGDGELRAVHEFETSGVVKLDFYYSYQKEQELLKRKYSARDAQWFSRICEPEFNFKSKRSGNLSFHRDYMKSNSEALFSSISKQEDLAYLFNSFNFIVLYYSAVENKFKSTDKQIQPVFDGLKKYVLNTKDSTLSSGLSRSSRLIEGPQAVVKMYAFLGGGFGAMGGAFLVFFLASNPPGLALLIGMSVGVLVGVNTGKEVGKGYNYFASEVTRQVEKLNFPFNSNGSDIDSKAKMLSEGFRQEISAKIKSTNPETRRYLAMALNEYWLILGTGMMTLPENSGSLYMYKSLITLIEADEVENNQALNPDFLK